uniref:Uncharacterized protein n=1 Tax=Opuntia streptacantha TaxID=393608 RepID=A0A7C8ZS93_OPUST
MTTPVSNQGSLYPGTFGSYSLSQLPVEGAQILICQITLRKIAYNSSQPGSHVHGVKGDPYTGGFATRASRETNFRNIAYVDEIENLYAYHITIWCPRHYIPFECYVSIWI